MTDLLTRTANRNAVLKDGFSVAAVRTEESALMHFREESKLLPALFKKERQRVLKL